MRVPYQVELCWVISSQEEENISTHGSLQIAQSASTRSEEIQPEIIVQNCVNAKQLRHFLKFKKFVKTNNWYGRQIKVIEPV